MSSLVSLHTPLRPASPHPPLKDDLPISSDLSPSDLDPAPAMHGSQESLFDFNDDSEVDLSASATTSLDRNGAPKSASAAARSPKAPRPAPAARSTAPAPSSPSGPPASEPMPPGPESTKPAPAEPCGAVGEGASIAPLAKTLHRILQKEITPEQYQTWFQRSALIRIDDETATIAVPNSFALEWVKRYYLNILESTLTKVLGQRRRIELVEQPEVFIDEAASPGFAEADRSNPGPGASSDGSTADSTGPVHDPVVQGNRPQAEPRAAVSPLETPSGTPAANGAAGSPAGSPPGASPTAPASAPTRRLVGELESSSDFVLNQKCTFDNFVVGPCNRFGHAASMGAAEQPGKSYNPLFLHGPVGVGKTHLLQAFCFSVLERFPDYRILYLSCETFVNHFIGALDAGDMQRFRDKYRDIDVLVIDDIQTLANKEKSQEEFFHTFNSLYNAGKQIVLSADCPPTDIPTLHDRLVSRFKWGMVTEIEPPCYETRMAIVKRKSRERGGEVPDEIAQFIAENIEENVRELEGAVTRLLAYSRMTGAEITLELAREALAGLIEVRKGAPTVDDIVNLVTDHYQVKLSDLQSKRRPKAIAYPRQVAMYLARKVTRHSLEEIGGFFGGRDHTTVLYAVDKMEKLVATDPGFSKEIQVFMDRLGSNLRHG